MISATTSRYIATISSVPRHQVTIVSPVPPAALSPTCEYEAECKYSTIAHAVSSIDSC